MAETAARVSWAGVGLSVPWRLCRSGPLRWAVRELLREPRFAQRTGRIKRWAAANDGARRAADLVEAQALRAGGPRPGP
jgi:UDP:flavonoid glycosyltransferase YjiC (YdhE family)